MRGRGLLPLLALLPAALLLGAGFFWPVLRILPESLTGTGFTQLLAQQVYLDVVLTTVRIGVETALITLVLAYPIAWFISTSSGARQILLIVLVLVPFLTSALVRTFAWIAVLGTQGLLNSTLQALGIVSEPIPMLFTEGAVVTALVHVSLPLMTFPLVAVMRKTNPHLIMVGQSLGANRLVAFLRVIVPLTKPGIRSGLIVVILFAMASFIAPAILGGTKQTMLAQLIQSTIETGSNRSFAAALSVALAIVATALVVAIAVLLGVRWRLPHRKMPTSGPGAHAGRVARRSLLPARFGAVIGHVVTPLWAVYLTAVALFSVLPLLILVPVSFTSGEVLVFPTPGFSTRWYEQLAADPDWGRAALTSLRIGLMAAVAATLIALSTVLGIGRRRLLNAIGGQIVLLPLMIPAVVFALGAYVTFARIGLVDNELGLAIAQTILALPVAFLVVSAAYAGIDPRLERAAASLGARGATVVTRVVLPLMAPALTVCFFMSLLLSFDESVASVFLSGLRVETLPRRLWSGIRFSTSPEVAAAAVLVLAFALLVIGVTLAVVNLLGRGRLGRPRLADLAGTASIDETRKS